MDLSTDTLLFGVIAAIGVNRVFQASRLRLSRLAYVVVQMVNMGFVLGLTLLRLPEFQKTPQAELAIRLFLLCFVAWHMVRNSAARTKALRVAEDVDGPMAERRARVAAFEATQSAQRGEAQTGEGVASEPEPSEDDSAS